MIGAYRIGRIEDRTLPCQFITPLTCYILSAFPFQEVPLRFRGLRRVITDVEVARDKYISEIVMLLNLLPKSLSVDSELLRQISTSLQKPLVDAVKLYTLAYLVPRRDAYQTLVPKSNSDQAMNTFLGVCAGISNQRNLARARIDLILLAILSVELDNRFYTISRLIDSPFYIPAGNETVILCLTHYHLPFVKRFREVVSPFIRRRSLDRVQELARLDFNLFVSALRRVPARSDPSTLRLETLFFGKEGHPEASRVVWSFCSIWFKESLCTFRSVWNLKPETLRLMHQLAMKGTTVNLLEATRPFGSKI
jgi:hypothetical protein